MQNPIQDNLKAKEELQESKNQLQTLINAMPDFICFKDGDGRWLKVNDAGIHIFQLEGIDYYGKNDSELAELSSHLKGAFLTCKQSDEIAWKEGNLFCGEEVIPRPDGTIRVYDVVKVPVFHSNGKRKGIVVMGHDITEIRKVEEALLKSEGKYRSLTENMSDIVYSIDLDGILTYISPQTKQYGIDPETLVSRSLLEIVHPEDRDNIVKEYQRALRTGEEFPRTFRAINVNGGIHWFEDIGKIQRDKDGNVTGLAGVLRDITERKLAEEALLESEEKMRTILNSMPDVVLQLDPNMTIIWANNTSLKINPGAIGLTCYKALPGRDDICPDCPIIKALETGKIERGIVHLQSVAGAGESYWDDVGVPIKDTQGKVISIVKIARNITDMKRAEEEKSRIENQYRQAQKMESVGRLAGGVAHDFNNMLGVILGYTEMSLDKLDPSHPIYAALQEIRKAADRSANLTRQLLAFARRQTVSPRLLDLNETVEGMLQMLHRLIGEDINLEWLPAADLWQIMVDPTQIVQILANLCINSRDAIKGVGRISIETENVVFDKTCYAEHPEFTPGKYVLLTVSDNGCGMDKDTLDNLFEPFFTTKEVGQGTGLGLATVYGIVKQNNGYIYVYSEPGEGTTFKIYLPPHAGKMLQMQNARPAETVRRGHETILLVEDEPSILKMAKTMLERQGYTVLDTTSPGEALRLVGECDSEIHLLMTDVVMPEMNGRELASNLVSLYPDMKCLFMSGYTANVIAHRRVLDEGVNFIQKPFSMQDLSAKVREVLDS